MVQGEHSLHDSKALHVQQAARQGRGRCDVVEGGGGAACARGFDNANAALARDVIGSREARVLVMTWAVRTHLDLASERLPSTVALQGATLQPASNSERLTCAAENGGRAAWTRTGEIQTAVAVGIRAGPHEREAALERARVAAFTTGEPHAVAPQNEEPRRPLCGEYIRRCNAVQGQVEAEKSPVWCLCYAY